MGTVTLDSLSQDERDKEWKTYAKGDGKTVVGQGGKAEKSTWNLVDQMVVPKHQGYTPQGLSCRDICCPGTAEVGTVCCLPR